MSLVSASVPSPGCPHADTPLPQLLLFGLCKFLSVARVLGNPLQFYPRDKTQETLASREISVAHPMIAIKSI